MARKTRQQERLDAAVALGYARTDNDRYVKCTAVSPEGIPCRSAVIVDASHVGQTAAHKKWHERGHGFPKVPAEVFGPGRPAAARAAIYRLAEVTAWVSEQYGGWAPDWAYDRLTIARKDRDQYSDYGDTFAGH